MRSYLVLSATLFTASLFACASSDGSDDTARAVEQASTGGGNAAAGAVFFNVGFPDVHGNGRTCATCHNPLTNFTITPEQVEARYQLLQARKRIDPRADDPLFRSIDANDGANDYTNLRQHALIRVVISLPKDAAGNKLMWPVDDPDATEVAVWRGVPTVNNVAFTAPYQFDGRFPTLQVQALAALHGHSQITNDPAARFLDDVAAYEKKQFSSPQVAALGAALANGQPPPETDPPLTELEQQGKALFQAECSFCHGSPTETVFLPFLNKAVQNIMVSKPVPPFAADLPFPTSGLPFRLWAIKQPDGSVTVIPSTDPGMALETGDASDFGNFDMPTLYGISKTAPYFHDNSAKDLNEVLIHYQSFFTALGRVGVGAPTLTDDQFPALIAYLKRI